MASFFTKTKLYKGFLPHGKILITATDVHSTNSYCYWQWDSSCFTYFVQLRTNSTRFHCKLNLFVRGTLWTGQKLMTKCPHYVHEILVNIWQVVHVMVCTRWPTLVPALIPNWFMSRFLHYIQIPTLIESHGRKLEVEVGQCWKSQLTSIFVWGVLLYVIHFHDMALLANLLQRRSLYIMDITVQNTYYRIKKKLIV